MTQPKYMSCPTVRLFRCSRTHNTKQKIWIPYQATERSSSRPVQDPGLRRRGISKHQFWSQSLKGIFNCTRRRSNTEWRCMAPRLQRNPMGKGRGRRGTVRGGILTSTKVPLSTAQFYARKYFCGVSLMTPFGLVNSFRHFGVAVYFHLYLNLCQHRFETQKSRRLSPASNTSLWGRQCFVPEVNLRWLQWMCSVIFIF
jgi:hypothetical protein